MWGLFWTDGSTGLSLRRSQRRTTRECVCAVNHYKVWSFEPYFLHFDLYNVKQLYTQWFIKLSPSFIHVCVIICYSSLWPFPCCSDLTLPPEINEAGFYLFCKVFVQQHYIWSYRTFPKINNAGLRQWHSSVRAVSLYYRLLLLLSTYCAPVTQLVGVKRFWSSAWPRLYPWKHCSSPWCWSPVRSEGA